jgi:hypothetical protein
MKKKMRRFAAGGYETTEGENENISDETRSRARKFIEDGSPEQDTGAKPVTVTKTKTSVTAAKPKSDDSSEKDRMEKLVKEQALERVEPENYIPGPGLLKGMFKNAVRAGERQVVGKASAKPAETIAKNTRKSEEGFSPDEALKQLKPIREAAETASLKKEATTLKKRIAENDVAEKRLRTRNKNNEDSESVRARASKLGMKSGGKVSSASKRADGCCIRGKTRA